MLAAAAAVLVLVLATLWYALHHRGARATSDARGRVTLALPNEPPAPDAGASPSATP